MSDKKFEYTDRPPPKDKIENIDSPTVPTQEIKDLIVKVQLKLICECIIISKSFHFVNHCYIRHIRYSKTCTTTEFEKCQP